jgi:hypothetical protein
MGVAGVHERGAIVNSEGRRSGALVICVVGIALLLAAPASAQERQPPVPQPKPSRWFAGGGVGAAFGTVSYIEFTPVVGFQVVPRFQLGGRLIFRYRKDKRFEPDLSTTDYGGALFGRYFAYGPIYLHGEVERLNWEYIGQSGDDFRAVQAVNTALYAGLGFELASTRRSALYMTFLYDFNFDSSKPNPNSDPFVIRMGAGLRF